jgi:hypothetical protein
MFCEGEMRDDDVWEELRRLRTENEDLRRASERFGELAERLNRQLLEERRLRMGAAPRPKPVPVITTSVERRLQKMRHQ